MTSLKKTRGGRKLTAIVLTDFTRITPAKSQFLQWSESGKSVELWEAEPLRLIKRWPQSQILFETEEVKGGKKR